MIKKFENFDKLNEEKMLNKNTLQMVLAFLIAFNSLKTDYHRKYSYAELYNYAQKLNVKNNNPLIKQAMNEVKNKIMTDPRIIDKNGLIKALDDLIFVNLNKDHITMDIYNHNKSNASNIDMTKAFIYYIEKKGAIIFLRDNVTLEDIIHEISHYVDYYNGENKDIAKMFDFNKDPIKAIYLYAIMTDQIVNKNYYSAYKIYTPVLDRNVKKYLSSPSEIYVRLNNLRIFLYKNHFLSNINANIDNHLLASLLSGDVYRELSEKEKKKFLDSDFLEILMFIDIENIDELKKINMYVQGLKNNKGFTPNYA